MPTCMPPGQTLPTGWETPVSGWQGEGGGVGGSPGSGAWRAIPFRCTACPCAACPCIRCAGKSVHIIIIIIISPALPLPSIDPLSPLHCMPAVNILVSQLDWFDGAHHCLLNMERGMLILHPDLLLSGGWPDAPPAGWPSWLRCVALPSLQNMSATHARPAPSRASNSTPLTRHSVAILLSPEPAGTRITTSHECPRRSFLDERVAGSGSNDKAVKGTLQHNLIQVGGQAGGGGGATSQQRMERSSISGDMCQIIGSGHSLLSGVSLPDCKHHADPATPSLAPSLLLPQAALTEGLRTPPQLYACAERVVGEATEALLEVDLSEEAALQCLKEAVPGIMRCAGRQAVAGAGWQAGRGWGTMGWGGGLWVCGVGMHCQLASCREVVADKSGVTCLPGWLQVDAPLPARRPCLRLSAGGRHGLFHRQRHQAHGGGAGEAGCPCAMLCCVETFCASSASWAECSFGAT